MQASYVSLTTKAKTETSFIMTFKQECRVIIKLRSQHQWKTIVSASIKSIEYKYLLITRIYFTKVIDKYRISL